MELAISSAERANAFVATDMGVPGIGSEYGEGIRTGRLTLRLHEATIAISVRHVTLGDGPGK